MARPRKQKAEPSPNGKKAAKKRKSGENASDESGENLLKKMAEIESDTLAAKDLAELGNLSEEKLKSDLGELAEDETAKFWTSFHVVLAESILTHLKKDGDEFSAKKNDEKAISVASRVAFVAVDTIDGDEVPEGLQQSVFLLHGILGTLSGQQYDHLNGQICKLCENWYAKNFPDKESLALNAFLHLLAKATSAAGSRNDVKRIHSLEGVLLHQNMKDDERLRNSLFKAAKCPFFVKCVEGQRFLAFLFTLSPSFTKEIHAAMKVGIPGASKQLASAYGEVYMKAWTRCSGQFLTVFEEDCLQDFMYHCVLANRDLAKSQQIFEPLLAILSPIHRAKNTKSAQEMVHRLWEPLLWRNLNVANHMVRLNAAQILFDVFPLENPNMLLEERMASQESQLRAMRELLKDDVPAVRVAAIEGVGRILSAMWLIISADDVKETMSILVRDLSYDSSSFRVRQSVLKALTYLVKNCPRSHLYLKKILPKVKDMICDPNELVRLAMVDLLLAVKAVKSIKFWDICGLDMLLRRLAADNKKSVCSRIVGLLFNSFFPADEADKLEKCIYLIRADQDASRRFYLHSDKFCSLHDVVRFILYILVTIKRHIRSHGENMTVTEDKENVDDRSKSHGNPSANGDGEHETTKTTEKNLSGIDMIEESRDFTEDLDDEFVVGGLIDIVCTLWMVRSKELAKKGNDDYRCLLEKKSSKILSILFKYYKSCEVHRSVVYLCSFLPHASAAPMSAYCFSQLKKAEMPRLTAGELAYPEWARNELPFDTTIPEEASISVYVDSLCLWGRGGDILDLISNWLQPDTRTARPSSTKSPMKPSRKRGVQFSDEPEAGKRPDFALVLLRHLLSHKINRPMLLRKSFGRLGEVYAALAAFTEKVVTEKGDETLVSTAWMLRLKIMVTLYIEEERDPERLKVFLQKCLRLSNFAAEAKLDDPRMDNYFAATFLSMCDNLFALDICDGDFARATIRLAKDFVLKVPSIENMNLVLHFVAELAEWAAFQRELSPEIVENVVPEAVEVLVRQLVAVDAYKVDIVHVDRKSFSAIFESLESKTVDNVLIASMADILMDTISVQIEEMFNDSPLADWNKATWFLFSVLTAKATISRKFVARISTMWAEMAKNGDEDNFNSLATFAVVVTGLQPYVKVPSLSSELAKLRDEVEAEANNCDDDFQAEGIRNLISNSNCEKKS